MTREERSKRITILTRTIHELEQQLQPLNDELRDILNEDWKDHVQAFNKKYNVPGHPSNCNCFRCNEVKE